MPDNMSGNQTDHGPINVNEEDQVRYWTQQLGISELDLRAAVGKVGFSPDKVREFVTNGK